MILKKNSLSNLQNPVTSLQFIHLLRFSVLFLISIAFAKSNYTIDDIGVYEKFLYFAGALSFFWTNGILQSFLSLYNKCSSNYTQDRLIFNSIFLSFVFGLIIILLLLFFEKQFSLFFINSENIPYKILFVCYLALSPVTYFIEYIYLVKKQYKNIFRYGISTYLAQLIFLVIPAFIFHELIYSLYGLILITILRFIWLIKTLFKNQSIEISKYEIYTIIKNSAPLILSAFIAGSLPYIDGILVSSYYDDKTFAIFRYGARELPISLLLANAFSNAMIPIISSSLSLTASLKQIKVKSLKLMHVLFPVSILLIISSYFLFEILFNPNFKESAKIFNVMLLLTIPRMIFPQTILIAKQYQTKTLVASSLEWIIKLILSLWLLQVWGIFGIAIATFISFVFEKAILSFFVYQKLRISPTAYIPIKWYTFYSIILLITFLIVEHHNIFM